MSVPLTDESYARAALTYLAEPADRWLGLLIAAHGAAQTLDAIKKGRLLALPARTGAASGTAVRRAMERWRVRLTELPSPDEVAGYRGAGIRLICPGDPEWPGQLADLGDEQPYALWLRGNADLRFSCLRSVAIVGSRAATSYGSFVAAEFAASVAARGWAVVSGGAYGVDAAAHRGALSADGVTVAVLACGVDVPYPAGHADLFDAIAAQGVIVSEWPPGRTVTRLRFLVRNRVIAPSLGVRDGDNRTFSHCCSSWRGKVDVLLCNRCRTRSVVVRQRYWRCFTDGRHPRPRWLRD